MAHRFWPGGKASVILLPSGEQGAALLARAGQWTEMGLLGPALWVMPEQVSMDGVGPPVIGATVLGIGRDQHLISLDVDLFETLAREALQLVRMIKLRSASPSRELDAEQDRIADTVAASLTQSMPMATPSTNVADRATDLARVTLICAPSEFQLRQRVDWAAMEYGTVVVASPEDRSSPWSGDAFVRDNERFVGFALMHLASVAGLWSGVEKGTFELFPGEASGFRSVWVSRVFLNAVLTESLGRRTAAGVLEEAGRADSLLIDPSVGAPPEGTFYIEDGDVTHFTAAMVDAVMSLDGAALAFHVPAEVPDPGRRRIGIGAQLGSFFAFSGDKLAGMPRWSWRWITSSTGRSLTRRLHGDEGTHVVGDDLDKIFDLRDRMLIADRNRITESERAARVLLAAPVGVGQIRTTPRLWTRLRELVFGSLDGSSDLSDLGFAEVEGKVPVFGRVNDVFEAPDQLWSPPRGGLRGTPTRVGWHEVALEDPRLALVRAAEAAAGARVQAEARIGVAQRHLAELEHRRDVGEWQSVIDGTVAHAMAGPEGMDAAATEGVVTVTVAGTTPEVDAAADGLTAADLAVADAAVVAPAAVEVLEAERSDAASANADEDGDDTSAAPLTRAALKAEAAPDPATIVFGDEPEAASATTVPAAPADPAAPAASPRGSSAKPPRRSDPALQAALFAANANLLDAEQLARTADAEAVLAAESVESFDIWSVQHERSFVWRLLSRLADDRRSAQDAADAFARGIDDLDVQQPGALIRLRKRFHFTMLIGWLVIVAVAALLILLPIWFENLRVDVPWYPSDPWIFTVAALAALVLTLAALSSYHRGWSQFQRRVDLAHAHLARMSQGSVHARGEVARLDSLHRQTVDWLALLARGIHRPWHVPEEWLQRPSYGLARDSMPFAMQIGQVQDDDHAAATRLKRMTKERLVVKGWRLQAFNSLIAEVAAELGQASASFGLAALDEDLPHSSNHTREMLRENMGNEAVLTRVAGPRLRELMASIQRSALHGSKPLVHPIGDNPLRQIASLDPVGGSSDDVPWDDFLLGSLAGRRDPVTPLSAVSMSDVHVQEGHHEHVRSFLVLPERLEAHLEFRPDAPVSLIPYGSGGAATLDLVWRVDMAGPLPISAIRLWDVSGDGTPAGAGAGAGARAEARADAAFDEDSGV